MATIPECADCGNVGFYPTEYKDHKDEYHFECSECSAVLILKEPEE